MWSPITSSCFASVADDGRIEIWELATEKLAPVFTHFDKNADGTVDNTAKTIVRFLVQGSKAPVILTGNSKGQVDVYRSYGLKHGPVSHEDQVYRLKNAIKKDDFSDPSETKADE